ncbi:hypothetical protein FRC11_000197 [Ceratobasidium sp. 423]|nr:hypothetical protein FRC11_000197 [Ceratobasidium sp. 423]
MDETPFLQHIDRSFDSIVYFVIGELQYQWDTQHNTLLFQQVEAGPSASGLEWFNAHLYTTLEEAKALVAQPSSSSNLGGTDAVPGGHSKVTPQDHTQSTSNRSVGNVRSNEMTPLEMLECLKDHGCSDLRSLVDPNRFSSCRVAEGSFGDVWKGQLIDGTNIAVKVLRYGLVCESGGKSMKRAMRELYNWSKLKHKNIHSLLGVTMFEERVGMVSNWMENGTLKQYLKRCGDINRRALCIGVAEGVAYLHSVNMIHGDLKACNILVSSDGVPKLTDFDHSILSDSSLVFSATTRIGGGTLRWMAPELGEESQEKTKHTDVYALGMVYIHSIPLI